MTLEACPKCQGKALNKACQDCNALNGILQRFANANIPVRYWRLKMSEFLGPSALKKIYDETSSNLDRAYKEGLSFCLTGSHGVGKTMTVTSILRSALAKGYSGFYTTLNQIVLSLTSQSEESRIDIRKAYTSVDFLIIDEFDPRHMGSDNAADLFGRILEDIFRTRVQNNLPTLMCTNSPNVQESFQGSIKTSITSLMSYVKDIPVIGKDMRKEKKL
jgi:DNA replication protein DnaC